MLLSAKAGNLDRSKILLFGKEIKDNFCHSLVYMYQVTDGVDQRPDCSFFAV